MTDANVILWGRRIGAVSWDDADAAATFQYAPTFVAAGIEPSPLVMPLREAPYAFRALGRDAFKGLPGLLADALPDSFGNALIDVWLAETGRRAETFNPVDRLCYVGTRGIGALEFQPAVRGRDARHAIEIAQMVDLANRALADRAGVAGRLGTGDDSAALQDILQVGTLAGGARAKAVLAWNPHTGEFRSGQVDAAAGFEHWLLKFDGVANNRDRELADPLGFGRIEYAYHLMAAGRDRNVGLPPTPRRQPQPFHDPPLRPRSRGPQAPYAVARCAVPLRLQHARRIRLRAGNRAIQRLGLGMAAVKQLCRRAVFNIVARNQDDHVKNISFLMDRSGEWRLAPAYDVAYAYNLSGNWTGQHQMSLARKRDGFERNDLLRFTATAGLKRRMAGRIIDEVTAAVADWPRFAAEAGVPPDDIRRISGTHRMDLR